MDSTLTTNQAQTTNALEIAFSAVQNARDTATHTITLAAAFEAITGPLHAATVARIREHVTAGRKDEASAIKKTLPAFMFSGTFTSRRSAALQQHSGLMVLDFDACGTDRKAELANDPHAVLCFISPSGNGLKLVIKIEGDTATHGESFDAARTYYRDQYDLDADKSGRDVARLCFVSHDPNAMLKGRAEVLHRLHMTTQTIHDYTSNGAGGAGSGAEVAQQVFSPSKVESVLAATQPTQPGQRHRKLFDLARGLRFDCGLADKPLKELKPLVQGWHEMSLPRIGTQSFTESWADFCHAWPRAKKPLSVNQLLAAWQSVQSQGLPPEAAEYDDPQVQKLVALCFYLANPNGTFFLSMHDAARLLKVQPMQIKRWLKMLQVDEHVCIIEPGTPKRKSTVYAWKRRFRPSV